MTKSRWEAVIGLECHVQLMTASKSFSASASHFGAEPNTQADPVVLGLPGALPVLNRRAVEYAIKIGLATGCEIRRRSRFARKHYFYPDLPKGYQISQYDEPLCEHGTIELAVGGVSRTVRLTRIHMEEDAGKNLHQAGSAFSLVDLNRAGVPLVEIVSEPDIRSAEEAAEYMRTLRQIVRYLGISDGNMEEGSLRCDANVSLREVGTSELGTKTELKNINSFKFVQKAIEHEIARQAALLDAGKRIVQETRLWDADRGVSHSMRTKEQAHDYRYFPDPDLPPLMVPGEWIEEIRRSLPELPAQKRVRFMSEYSLSEYDARILTEEHALADYFESGARSHGDAKKISNWIQTELLRELNRDERSIEQCPIRPEQLAELVRLIDGGVISGKIGKEVFAKMFASGESPKQIVEREGLVQVTDTTAIEAAARAALAASPKQVEQYRAGKTSLLGYFVGQVMKATQGKANPQALNEILKRLLEETR
ncbi:MAG: Asp-tRNA(Asn)/Glu-tRNA(Gln) amidotransferase subunit GatB [Deltaproteobacteria bacterium]|nr:Asp-tRNA(Asn)/Glu-tRNA(Gln) amidotransferase subunit GatB [Deltaproteobacteria bacterium]